MTSSLIEQRLKRRALCFTIVKPRTTTSLSIESSKKRLHAIYGRGVMWTDDGAISLDDSPVPAISIDTARQRSGQWFLVFADIENETYRFVVDPLGYYRLYYTSFTRGNDDVIVIGDNLTSVVGEVRRLGHSVTLDWPVAAAHLFSTHTIMQSSFTHRTVFEGIRALPAGADLILDSRGIREESRNIFEAPPGASYEELLAAGIAKAQRQLQLIAESSVTDKRHALSGGRDSRIAMAITHSAGVHTAFSVMTADPRTSRTAESKAVLDKDLRVASSLRRFLGLQWVRETGIVGLRHNVHDSLDIFQSRYGGARFTWLSNNVITWPSQLRLEIHGGSGELLRRAYQNMRNHPSFSELSDRADTLATDAAKLFATVVRHSKYIPDDIRNESALAFAESMNIGADRPLSEQLNLHYAHFRNRDHFGEIIHRFSRNALVYYPLAQPEFLQASRLVDPDERSRGRVAFDIIQMTTPQLNDMPFDDGHWPESFGTSRLAVDQAEADLIEADLHAFFAGEDEDTQARAGTTLFADPKCKVNPFDGLGAAASLATSSTWELIDSVDAPIPQLDTLIPTLLAQSDLNPAVTAAKIETMSTVFSGRHAAYARVVLPWGQYHTSIIDDDGARLRSEPETIRISRGEPVVFHVDLRKKESVVSINVRLPPGVADDFEWAFYLYAGKNKIASRWYATSRSTTFDLNDSESVVNRVRALVFARPPGGGQRVFKRFSPWVQL